MEYLLIVIWLILSIFWGYKIGNAIREKQWEAVGISIPVLMFTLTFMILGIVKMIFD